jgi:hypothetical protein
MAIFLSKTGWDVQGQLVKADAGGSVFDAVSQRWPDMGHHARCGVLVQAGRVEPDMPAGDDRTGSRATGARAVSSTSLISKSTRPLPLWCVRFSNCICEMRVEIIYTFLCIC